MKLSRINTGYDLPEFFYHGGSWVEHNGGRDRTLLHDRASHSTNWGPFRRSVNLGDRETAEEYAGYRGLEDGQPGIIYTIASTLLDPKLLRPNDLSLGLDDDEVARDHPIDAESWTPEMIDAAVRKSLRSRAVSYVGPVTDAIVRIERMTDYEEFETVWVQSGWEHRLPDAE